MSLHSVHQKVSKTEGRLIRRCFPLGPELGGINDELKGLLWKSLSLHIPSYISANYSMSDEEAGMSFHSKCLYANPPPVVDCDLLNVITDNKARFIAQMLDE